MKDFLKHMRFIYFIAWWVITLLLGMYLYAILLPEKFANSPIVTQFTTMAGTVITMVLGYFFGGMNRDKYKSAEPGTVTIEPSDPPVTTTIKTEEAPKQEEQFPKP